MSIQTKLKNLESKAKSKGEFALCAAAAYLSRDLSGIDARINLLGALHECGYLQNSLKPYRTELGADSPEWTQRCLQLTATTTTGRLRLCFAARAKNACKPR